MILFKNSSYTKKIGHQIVFKSARAQFHLELIWASTAIKHQGMAANVKLVTDLDKNELDHRAYHTASRKIGKSEITWFKNGIARIRLFRVIKKHAKMKRIISEEKT